MKTAATITAALLAGILLVGCSIDFSGQEPPKGEPDIRGVVISYEPGVALTDLDAEPAAENYPSMVVVWTDDPGVGTRAEYDAAQVQTDGPTLFFNRIDGELQEGYEDLEVGSVVEIWFKGPVRESYPVQATADSVVVVGVYDGELPKPAGLEP